jgi:hypothetical protein
MPDIDEYNLKIDELRKLIKPRKTFNSAIELALEIHAITHTSKVSSGGIPTFCDNLLDGLTNENYSAMPTEKDETIAWHLWHIARIEDLVGNLLITRFVRRHGAQNGRNFVSRAGIMLKDIAAKYGI